MGIVIIVGIIATYYSVKVLADAYVQIKVKRITSGVDKTPKSS